MCTHKSYIHGPGFKFDYCHDPVPIAPNIKYITVITYGISSIEAIFHFMKITPIS